MHRHLTSVLRPSRALLNAREALTHISGEVAARGALAPVAGEDLVEGSGALRALTRTECYELLAEASVGRLAYIARADTPDIVPVNYGLEGEDLLIRSGPGPKLQAAERGARVAFEVDVVDPVTRIGRSVVVIGRATRMRLAEQWLSQPPGSPWAAGPRDAVIRIRPTRVTGRRLS